MISENSSLVIFKVTEVEFKPNGVSGAIPRLSYTLADPRTSKVVFKSSTFEPSEISSFPPTSLKLGLLSRLVFSFYMEASDNQIFLGSTLIDLSQNLHPKTWWKIPNHGDEILSIEIEIIKEKMIESPRKNMRKSENTQEKRVFRDTKKESIKYPHKSLNERKIEEFKDKRCEILNTENNSAKEESIKVPCKAFNENKMIQKIENPNSEILRSRNEIFKEENIEAQIKTFNESGMIQEKCENLQIVREDSKIEEEISELLRKYEIDDINNISREIELTKEDIEYYGKRNKNKEEKNAKNKLADLERLLILYNELKATKDNEETKQNKSISEEENLDEELKEGLIKYNIENPQKIQEKINETKDYISLLTKRNKFEEVENEKNALADLEKLYSIYRKSESMIIIDSKEIENQKKADFIEAMINDISIMPFCAEKSLTSILCLAYCRIYNVCLQPDIQAKFNNIDQDKALEHSINYLDQNHTQRLKSKFMKHLNKSNWELLIEDIKSILKEHIRPLNIKELSRLIDKSAQCSENLENKDIILLIGFTGSGKSTTTHFLCGSDMEKVLEDSVSHIKFTAIKNPLLKNVTISSRAESETRYITMIPVKIPNSQEVVYICDTAGWNDTDGSECDIANTISMVECAWKCRSVRPLILISSKGEGDRFEGVKKLAHSLARLVPNFNKYSRSFTYAFTKYSQEDARNIHALVKNSLKTLKNDSDKVFLKILEDIKKKTEDEVITINPLRDDPQELLRKIMESEKITDTRDAFQRFLTEDSSRSIRDQISVCSKGIVTSLDPLNLEIIKYNLDRMQYLVNLFEQFKPQYDESVKSVIKKIYDLYNNAIEWFDKILENNGIFDENDVLSYKNVYDALKASEEIRESHLKSETVRSAAMLNHLISKLNLTEANKESNEINCKLQLKNLECLSKSFEEIDYHYKQLCEKYINFIKNLLISAQSHLSTNNFDNFSENLLEIKKYFDIVSDIVDFTELDENYCNLLDQLIFNLKLRQESSVALLNKDYIVESDIELLKEHILIIKSAIGNQFLNKLIGINEINKLLLLIIDECKKNCEADFSISIENDRNREEIEAKLDRYNLLMGIPEIKVEIGPHYEKFLNSIVAIINSFKKKAKENVISFIETPGPIELESLRGCFKKLESMKWIEKFTKENFNELPKIEKVIKRFIDKQLVELNDIDLDIKFPINIQKGYSISLKSNLLVQLKEFIPSVSKYERMVWSNFTKRIEESLRSIQRRFSLDQKDFNREVNLIEFLYSLKKEYSKYENEGRSEEIEKILQINNFQNIEEVDQEISRNEKIIGEGSTPVIDILENSYTYIEECKKIPELSDSIFSIISSDIFSNLHQLYSGYLKSLIESFNAISNYFRNDSNPDMNSLKVFANQFSSNFIEMLILNEKSPSFFKILNSESWIEKCRAQLTSLYISASEKLKYYYETSQNESISLLLTIADEFARVDGNFSNISMEYKKLQDSGLQELFELIDNLDFYNFKQSLAKINEQNLGGLNSQITSRLSKVINNLLKDMKDDVNKINIFDFNHDLIEVICKNHRSIECAKKNNLYIYLDDGTINKFLTEEAEIKKDFKAKICNYLSAISNDISKIDFYEAETKLKNIPYSTMEELKHLFQPWFEIEIFKIRNGLDELSTNIINNLKSKEIKELKDYNLKKILRNFEKASEDFPKYREYADQIKNAISEKFNNLNNTFIAENVSNRKKIIQNIDSVLNNLPEDIKKPAESVMNKIKESLKKEKDEFNKKIDLYEKEQNIKESCRLYKSSKQHQSKLNLSYARDKLRKIICSIKDEINSALQHRNWEAAFNKAHVLALKAEVKEIIDDSDSIFKEIYGNLSELVDSNMKTLMNIECKDNSTELMESFNFYKILINFNTKLEKETQYHDIFRIDNVIQSTHAAILDFYEGLNKSYTEFKPPNNPIKCDEILNKIKDWDEFLKDFIEFLSNGRTYTNFDKKIKDQWRYSKFRSDLTKILMKINDFFTDFKVQYEDIMHQATLEKCAENIQENWNQIKNFSCLKDHLNSNTNLEGIKLDAINAIKNEMNKVVENALKLINKNEIKGQDFDQIRNYYNFLNIFEKNLKIQDLDLINALTNIKDTVHEKALEFKRKAEVGELRETEAMIIMKEISISFPLFKKLNLD